MTPARSGVNGRHRLVACCAVPFLVAGLGGCGVLGGGSGTASFAVTYQAEDGGPDATKQIEIEGVRCGEDEGGLSFRDSSAGPDDPEFSASTFESPSMGESFGFFTLRLGEDLVFHSTEVFDADEAGFTLDGHPGGVLRESGDDEVAVDPTATVEGSVTC